MSHILTVTQNILMSIRDESESSALLKAYSHENYTVKCLPCGWSRLYQVTELFDAPEYCPRCEFSEEGENAELGVEGVEQLHFSSPDTIPAAAPKELRFFKDELLVDGRIDLLKIFLEERQYWAGLLILLGNDWAEFLELLSQPLEYEVAFEQLARGYIGNIGVSAGDRTVYWDAIMSVTFICQMNSKGRSYRALERGYYLVSQAIDRKMKEQFHLNDISDIGLLSAERTLYWMVRDFQSYSVPKHQAIKHALAFGIYTFIMYWYVEYDKINRLPL